MTGTVQSILFEREEMTDDEKKLFVCDLKKVCAEYFECDGGINVDVTRIEEGFSICILFCAHRIKSFKKI
jgi:hypothetical protein